MTPKRCYDCSHMGAFGHGEPPYCEHPDRPKSLGPYEKFANPRGTPPDWCPLRQPAKFPAFGTAAK